SEQRERRSFDELLVPFGPSCNLLPGVQRFVEQMEADRIADAPVIEITAPAIHLRGCHSRGLVEERADHTGLIPARLAERDGEFVIAAELLRERLGIGDGNSERVPRRQAVTRHAVAISLRASALEPGEREFDIVLYRHCLCHRWKQLFETIVT